MKKKSIILTAGILTALASLIYSDWLVFDNVVNSSLPSYLVICLGLLEIIGGLLLGMITYRNKVNNGYAGFKELYKTGIFITLVVCCVTIIHYVILLIVYPDFVNVNISDLQAILAKKNFSPDQINTSTQMLKKVVTPFTIVLGTAINQMIRGSLCGLLAAAIAKKKKPN